MKCNNTKLKGNPPQDPPAFESHQRKDDVVDIHFTTSSDETLRISGISDRIDLDMVVDPHVHDAVEQHGNSAADTQLSRQLSDWFDQYQDNAKERKREIVIQ